MSWDHWADLMFGVNILLLLTSWTLGAVLWHLTGKRTAERIAHERALRHTREDAVELALYLRLAVSQGATITVSYTAEAAIDRALAWCPHSADGRHALKAGGVCKACRLGGFAANDGVRS